MEAAIDAINKLSGCIQTYQNMEKALAEEKERNVRLRQELDKHDVAICPICLDILPEHPALTLDPCQHQFHTRCIKRALKEDGRKKKCALCKQKVSKKFLKAIRNQNE